MANNDPGQLGSSWQQSGSEAGAQLPEPTTIDEQPTRPENALGKAQEAAIDEQPTRPGSAVMPEKTPMQANEPPIDKQPTSQVVAVADSANAAQQRQPVIAVRDLAKTYRLGGKTNVYALRGVSLDVYPGEFVAVMGPSGSGKSTFMNLIGCLDRPTSGEYWLAGKLVSRLSSDELAIMRNRLIGFVFQGFNLLGRSTAIQNVGLPMVYAGIPKHIRELRARKLLQLVGLGARMNHKPSELSGGQQQRVAIARALSNGPSLLLADEPTGNLDSRTSIEIMAVMQALNEQGLTIVLVTHEPDIANYAKRQVVFRDGRLIRDEPVLQPNSAKDEWMALVQSTNEDEGNIKEEHS